MKIVVFGLGYVGLANAILLSQSNEVIGIDTNEEKINLINQKKSPLTDDLIISYLAEKDLNLRVTNQYKNHLQDAELAIIAVPTNYDEDSRYFDTSFVDEVINNIKKENENLPILIKSTIPVGYTKGQREKFACENIIFSPEFLREGKALYDSLNPSRIIVGDKTDLGQKIANLYKKEARNDPEVLFMDSTEAEAVKLFANTYLAMRVSYFNELDTFAEIKGLSTKDIIEGVSADPRIGNYYNNPSFGYGGYCLPKDSKQLYANFENVPNAMFGAVIDANQIRKDYISDRILRDKPKTVGIYRLVMKKDSDNFRKSAIFDVINNIKNQTQIIIYEPNIDEDYFEGLKIENNLDDFKKANIIVANRLDDELLDVKDKVYTRDIFNKDWLKIIRVKYKVRKKEGFMSEKKEKYIPLVHSKLRKSFITVPKEIYKASGIMIFEKRIKSLLFTTDLAIIRNSNADSIMAVYPYTPQSSISNAVLSVSNVPCFIGVGGGTTQGLRSKYVAIDAELSGAYGVVVNSPMPNKDIKEISGFVDVPVIATVTTSEDDYIGKIQAGAEILNVSGGKYTADLVREIRKDIGDNFPIIATGGKTGESILETIDAGANAISYTPPSSSEVFGQMMDKYRNEDVAH